MAPSVNPPFGTHAPVAGLGARIGAVAWFLLGAAFLLALPVLLGIHGLLLPALAVLAAVLALLWSLVRRVFAGRGRRPGLGAWLRTFVGLLFALGAVAAVPIYALALVPVWRPLLVPQATLSNGTRTLLFQGAVHIGSEPFYKAMVYDIERALSEGYTIYYEGVAPNPQGDAWFKETVSGGGDLNTGYRDLGQSCGLKFQGEYFGALAGAVRSEPDRHVQADVDTLQLKQEFERKVAADPGFAERVQAARARKQAEASDGPDLMSRIIAWGRDPGARQHALAGVVCRGIVSIGLTSKGDSGDPMDELILDFRNRKLVERLLADPRERILLNYGAGHLKGLLPLLRQADPAWKVQEVRWMRALEAPEELRGPALE